MTELRPEPGPGPLRRASLSLASRLGCTEGQLQTISIGAVLAAVIGILGLPPVFDDRPVGDLVAAPPAAAQDEQAAPATTAGAEGAPAAASAPPGGAAPRPSRPAVADPPADPAAAPPVPSPPAAGPAPFELGVPGVNGSCSMTTRSVDNPRHAQGADAPDVWIYEPTGSAPGAATGGTCEDGRRPAIFIAHGFGQNDPVGYLALIEHLVSVGNVVIYPSYDFTDGSRATLEESYRVVDAGIVAAVAQTPRIDTSRVGWWGHSHGGGMVPYLAQQGGARGWGSEAFWLSIVAQAYTQLVGDGDIAVPAHAEAIVIAFEQDAFADARLGIDVHRSLALPPAQKRHATIRSGADASGPFLAEHGAPQGIQGQSDAVDVLLWRYADLMETCAIHGGGCDVDLTSLPGADGTAVEHATVSENPSDVGPYPAILAECDALYGPSLNPRIQRCGPTRI